MGLRRALAVLWPVVGQKTLRPCRQDQRVLDVPLRQLQGQEAEGQLLDIGTAAEDDPRAAGRPGAGTRTLLEVCKMPEESVG